MIAAIYARKSTEQTGADADAKVGRAPDRERARVRDGEGLAAWPRRTSTPTMPSAGPRRGSSSTVSGCSTRSPPAARRFKSDHARRLALQSTRRRRGLRRVEAPRAGGHRDLVLPGRHAVHVRHFGDNVVGFVRAEMNAEFRRQIGKWTHEAMVAKSEGRARHRRPRLRVRQRARRRPRRAAHQRAQAAVIRRIFALCAEGTGYTRIAKQLNAEGAPTPRPQHAAPGGWSPSTVHEVLHRPLYRGEVVCNQTRRRDAGRRRRRHRAARIGVAAPRPARPAHRVGRGVGRGARDGSSGFAGSCEQASGGRFGTTTP